MNTDKIYAESIVNEYSVKKKPKVVALKKLDRKVKLAPTIFAYTFGTVFTLLFGAGMCLSMGVIGSGTLMKVLGIAIGLIGILCVSVNYPIYKKMLTSRKEKYASDILALANEISKEEN